MNDRSFCLYEFGPYRLDPVKRLLWCKEACIPLKPKPLDALILLVESAGRLCPKEQLMEALWPDTIVEENNLTQCISVLRRALGESRADQYILTVPGRGYQFVADVRHVEIPDVVSVAEENEIASANTTPGSLVLEPPTAPQPLREVLPKNAPRGKSIGSSALDWRPDVLLCCSVVCI